LRKRSLRGRKFDSIANKYAGEVNIHYSITLLPGRRYKVLFDFSVSSGFFTAALEGSLKKLNVASYDINGIESWAADERLTGKIIKKMNKHLRTLEDKIAKDKSAPGFCFVSKIVPRNGCTFTKNGDNIDVKILVQGEYVF